MQAQQRLQVALVAEVDLVAAGEQWAGYEGVVAGQPGRQPADPRSVGSGLLRAVPAEGGRQQRFDLRQGARAVKGQHLGGEARGAAGVFDRRRVLRADQSRTQAAGRQRMGQLQMRHPSAPARGKANQMVVLHLRRPFRLRRQHPLLGPFQPVVQAARFIALRPSLALGFKRLHHFQAQARAQACVAQGALNQIVAEGAQVVALRLIVRVHVAADLVEGQIAGEGAGRGGADAGPRQRAGVQIPQPVFEGRQVELVRQAGAPGFQQHRKVPVPLGGRQQLLGLQPAHPQGQTLVEPLAGQQQGAAGALPKASAEEAGALQGLAQMAVQVLRPHQAQQLLRRQLVLELDDDGVVVCVDLRHRAVGRPPGGLQGQRPGAVEPPAPKAVDDHLLGRVRPLVAARPGLHPLQQQVAAMRQGGAGVPPLPLKVAAKLGRRSLVKTGLVDELGLQGVRTAGAELRFGVLQKAANPFREVKAAVQRLVAPKRRGDGAALRRAHDHVVVGDAQNSPILGAEGENLAGAGLPHELLVEFADLSAAVLMAQLVVAAVRDGAAGVVEGEHRAAAGAHPAVDAVEGQSGLEFPHPGAGVASSQKFEHQVKLLPWQPMVGSAGPDRGEQFIDWPVLVRAHGDDRLAKHVQGVLQDGLRLKVALRHRLRERRRIQQVLAVGGIEDASADFADAVAGAA